MRFVNVFVRLHYLSCFYRILFSVDWQIHVLGLYLNKISSCCPWAGFQATGLMKLYCHLSAALDVSALCKMKRVPNWCEAERERSKMWAGKQRFQTDMATPVCSKSSSGRTSPLLKANMKKTPPNQPPQKEKNKGTARDVKNLTEKGEQDLQKKRQKLLCRCFIKWYIDFKARKDHSTLLHWLLITLTNFCSSLWHIPVA